VPSTVQSVETAGSRFGATRQIWRRLRVIVFPPGEQGGRLRETKGNTK
jgi:hypothetical protein